MTRDSLTRFLGGSPGQVALRLLFLSFVVGVILSALNLDPWSLVEAAQRFLARLWNMGFDAIFSMGRYLVMGAVIVVPIWLVSRVLSSGRR
ncbi:DUF6460 domain-containing protein [Roseibium aestuarii]|uniref:DUF6460 domain-containing protein n=1 Tax=Roseibium aestuarii TaxID=2600299 RepID=A0ABW4JXW8_9HYPH|nr:DUF6460 domain-containing protein [Roseibium aestuarii]